MELSTSTDHSPYHIDVSFRTAEGPTDVIIEQFWFPGMRVTVIVPPDRARRVDPGILRDGRMILSLPPNAAGAIGVRYDGPPGWRIHTLFVAMWFVGLMFVASRVRKRGAV